MASPSNIPLGINSCLYFARHWLFSVVCLYKWTAFQASLILYAISVPLSALEYVTSYPGYFYSPTPWVANQSLLDITAGTKIQVAFGPGHGGIYIETINGSEYILSLVAYDLIEDSGNPFAFAINDAQHQTGLLVPDFSGTLWHRSPVSSGQGTIAGAHADTYKKFVKDFLDWGYQQNQGGLFHYEFNLTTYVFWINGSNVTPPIVPEAPSGNYTVPSIQGPTGPPGPPGAAGQPGEKGEAGPQGPAGPSGKDGKDGTDGKPGADGQPGPAGPMGPSGSDGKDGKDGKDGEQGIAGPQGPAGSSGPAGPAGPMGPPGKDGKDGKDGSQGSAGKDGKDGAQGPAGKDGLNGKDGVDGISLTEQQKSDLYKLSLNEEILTKFYNKPNGIGPGDSVLNYQGFWYFGSRTGETPGWSWVLVPPDMTPEQKSSLQYVTEHKQDLVDVITSKLTDEERSALGFVTTNKSGLETASKLTEDDLIALGLIKPKLPLLAQISMSEAQLIAYLDSRYSGPQGQPPSPAGISGHWEHTTETVDGLTRKNWYFITDPLPPLPGTPGAQGPPGVAGPQGVAGPSGQPGPQGPAGSDGKDGKDGRDGINGRDGKDGKDGLTGPQGPSGSDGSPGPAGPPGVAGPSGSDGKDGKDGRDGKDGLDGQDGIAGPSGPAGPRGPAGADGKDGLQGIQGERGERGLDGAPGTPGEFSIDYDQIRQALRDAVTLDAPTVTAPETPQIPASSKEIPTDSGMRSNGSPSSINISLSESNPIAPGARFHFDFASSPYVAIVRNWELLILYIIFMYGFFRLVCS